MRLVGVALGLVLLHGLPATCPTRAQAVQITAPEQVEYGRAFSLVVEWQPGDDGAGLEFDDRWLAPLVVRRLEVAHAERGGRRVEIRRYRAWAFVRGVVEVPRRDGEGVWLRLRVATSLTDGDGDVEPLQRSFGPAPLHTRRWAGAALLLAGLVLFGVGFRRVLRSRPGPPPPGPRERAAAAIAALRTAPSEGGRDDARAAAAVVRRYLAEQYGVGGPAITAADLRAGCGDLPVAVRAAAVELLQQCEIVVHSGVVETAEQRTRRLDALAALVEAL